MKRPANLSVFSLSFIDLFSCAFGGMMLLMVIFSLEQQDDSTGAYKSTVEIIVVGTDKPSLVANVSSGSTDLPQAVQLRKSKNDGNLRIGWVRLDATGEPVRVSVGDPKGEPIQVECRSLKKVLAEVSSEYRAVALETDKYDLILSTFEKTLDHISIARNVGNEDDLAMLDSLKAESKASQVLMQGLKSRDELLRLITVRVRVLQRLQRLLDISNAKECKKWLLEATSHALSSVEIIRKYNRVDEIEDTPVAPIGGEAGITSDSIVRIAVDDGEHYLDAIVKWPQQSDGIAFTIKGKD